MRKGRIYQVQEILDNEAWSYERKDNDILLLASYRTRKWKIVINCESESHICCYSVFPWPISEDKLAEALRALNELNLAQRTGCFMINSTDSRVVYRCGTQILDEYTSYDYIKYVLLSSVASVTQAWDLIHSVACGAYGRKVNISGLKREKGNGK